MKLTYAVVFEQTPNNYCASVPDVPGCVGAADSRDEMRAMIREAHRLPQRTHPRGCPQVVRRVRRRHPHALDEIRACGGRGPVPAGGAVGMTPDPAAVPAAGYTPDRVEDLIVEGRRLRALTSQRVTEIESTSGDPSGLSYH